MAINNYPMKWVELQKRCVEVGYTFRKLSFGLNRSKNYLSNAKDKNWNLEPKSIEYIANILLCKESDIAEIPNEIDGDHTVKLEIYHDADDIFPLPFALNYSEMLSPVEVVPAIATVRDFEHWPPLPETPNYHIEHKIDGRVAFRYENGHAVLFADGYMQLSDIHTKMSEIKKWGESLVSVHGGNV